MSPGGAEFLTDDPTGEGLPFEVEIAVRDAVLEAAAHSDLPLFVLANALPLSPSLTLLGYPTGPALWEELPDRDQRLSDLAQEVLDRVTVVAGPAGLSEKSQEIKDKIGLLQTPSAAELTELFAEIEQERPALQVSDDGTVPPYPGTGVIAAMWPVFASTVTPALNAVGLVSNVYTDGGAILHHPKGTVWLVAPDIVATNAHVIDQLTRDGWVPGSSAPGSAALVRFAVRHGSEGPAALCTRVLVSDQESDIALIRVDADSVPLPQAISITPNPTAANDLAGRYVAVLGYPFPDSRNPVLGDLVLKGAGGFQAVAPGLITVADDQTIRHECSTTGGNSGSPVMDLETGAVVGVHREGTRVLGTNIATRVTKIQQLLITF